MGDGNKKCFACCFPTTKTSSSPSAAKLLFCIVPLIVLSVFVFTAVSRNSTWVSFSTLPPPPATAVTSTVSGAVTDRVDVHGRLEEAVLSAELNRSASPPLAVEDVTGIHGSDETLNNSIRMAESFNISMGTPNNVNISMNESISTFPSKKTRQVRTKLDKLEAGLQRARVAIKDAKNRTTISDHDYAPIGPMYWDAKAFHREIEELEPFYSTVDTSTVLTKVRRSYIEMEKQFKIFVYKEGEPPVFHDGPCKSIYSMEGNFIHKMDLDTKFQTNDPEKAHVFYFPFSVAKMVQFVYLRDSRDFGPIKRTVIDYVNLVAQKYPYWNRSLGADHFMVACHDWGPEASFSLPSLQKNSIRALCNANTSEKFNPVKDVSIPEINLQTGKLAGLIGGPSASQRPILAFFAGGVHGPIRPILLEHWEGKDKDMRIHKYLPKGVNYYGMMRSSKFCICPSGYEVASPRIVESLYNGCVPVLISKSYIPPFSDVLRWKSFSVVVSVDEIPRLKEILTNISTRQYIRMYRRVLQVRRHFEFNSPPKRFDVFHMILHSVWLRRLNVRITDDNGVMTN